MPHLAFCLTWCDKISTVLHNMNLTCTVVLKLCVKYIFYFKSTFEHRCFNTFLKWKIHQIFFLGTSKQWLGDTPAPGCWLLDASFSRSLSALLHCLDSTIEKLWPTQTPPLFSASSWPSSPCPTWSTLVSSSAISLLWHGWLSCTLALYTSFEVILNVNQAAAPWGSRPKATSRKRDNSPLLSSCLLYCFLCPGCH